MFSTCRSSSNVCLMIKTITVWPMNKNITSCPTQGRVERWDAIKPLYWRSANSKYAGRPRVTHITEADEMKGNETNECGEMMEGNLWHGKQRDTREKSTQTPFRSPRNPHGVIETRSDQLIKMKIKFCCRYFFTTEVSNTAGVWKLDL